MRLYPAVTPDDQAGSALTAVGITARLLSYEYVRKCKNGASLAEVARFGHVLNDNDAEPVDAVYSYHYHHNIKNEKESV